MHKERLTEVIRKHLNPEIRLLGNKRLRGATEHDVQLLETDGTPAMLVAKIAPDDKAEILEKEYRRLRLYHSKSWLPVPEPYGFESSFADTQRALILMEYLQGEILTHAHIDQDGRRSVQHQLADILIKLHANKRETYGDALEGGGSKRHLDFLAPKLERAYLAVANLFEQEHRDVAEALLEDLEAWMPEFNEPTLIHGDIWDAHLIIDAPQPDKPRLIGLVDVQARYSDVEEELAHMLTFGTADAVFLDRYTQTYPLREGFERRKLVYELLIWLQYVQSHGTSFLRAACRTLDALRDAA